MKGVKVEGGESRRKKKEKKEKNLTRLSVWYLARDLTFFFIMLQRRCTAAADSAHYSASYERHADNEKHGPTRGLTVPPSARNPRIPLRYVFAVA